MRDVRAELFGYLDARQHLWNAHFKRLPAGTMDCHPLDDIDEVGRLLFFILVSQPLGLALPPDFLLGASAIAEICVRPKPYIDTLTARVSEVITDGNRSWQSPAEFASAGADLRFMDFFQWDNFDYQSMGHVRCEIRTLGPLSIGRECLVENHLVDFLLVPGGE